MLKAVAKTAGFTYEIVNYKKTSPIDWTTWGSSVLPHVDLFLWSLYSAPTNS